MRIVQITLENTPAIKPGFSSAEEVLFYSGKETLEWINRSGKSGGSGYRLSSL
jgi:hypothetical protein